MQTQCLCGTCSVKSNLTSVIILVSGYSNLGLNYIYYKKILSPLLPGSLHMLRYNGWAGGEKLWGECGFL